jgi:hypothetical protein
MNDSSIILLSNAASRPGSDRLSCWAPSLLPRTRTKRALHDWHLKLGSIGSAAVCCFALLSK